MNDRRQGHHHKWAYSDADEITGHQVRMCTIPGCEVRDTVDEKGIIVESLDRRARPSIATED